MPIEAKKREGESPAALISRFLKKIQQSGVLREAKKRRFHARNLNHAKRRISALHREQKKKEVYRAKKLGLI